MAEQAADKAIIHQLSNGFSFKLCWVEGGTFQMGSVDYEQAQPVHRVRVPSFYLSEYPVTQALWIHVLRAENPSRFVGLQRPVESISWYEAAAFCNQLNLHFGYTPVYFMDQAFQKPLHMAKTPKIEHSNAIPIFSKVSGPSFRLPSEAEWEYAARGGQSSGHFTYAGGDKLDEVGWYDDNSHGETKEVGLKLPNELGLYDLSGNVWEWCEDQYHDYRVAPNDGSAWLGFEADAYRVLRGGGWHLSSDFCRPFYRVRDPQGASYSFVGFRVVLIFPPGS